MHHLTVKTEEYGNIHVNHNGDWSDEVIINWHDPYDKVDKEVRLPGVLLLALSKKCAAEALRDVVISAVEDWDPGQVEDS